MVPISANAPRKDIYSIIVQVNENCASIIITNARGKGVVLVGGDEWAAIEETLCLMGIISNAKLLIEGGSTPVEDCADDSTLE